MERYLELISIAFFSYPAVAVLFTLPFLLVQYRRHGYIHKYRALILYLLLLYLLNAISLVLLPLPVSIHNEPPPSESYAQWIPFHFIQDIMRESEVRLDTPSTYLNLLRERAFLQVAFNVLLTVPFGVFLRYYFRRSWQVCLFLSLGLALLFEITQVTGIYSLYDYPYRLFDVDDLLMNTLGGLLGFIIADWLGERLPQIDKLDEQVNLATTRVSYTRRGVAFLCDWAVMFPLGFVLHMLQVPLTYWAAIALYFIVFPLATNGRTLGKWLVRIRLRGKSERILLRELVIRYGLLYGLVGGLHITFIRMVAASYPGIVLAVVALTLFILDAFLVVHVLYRLFNRKHRLFYEERSGTYHVVS